MTIPLRCPACNRTIDPTLVGSDNGCPKCGADLARDLPVHSDPGEDEPMSKSQRRRLRTQRRAK